MSLAYEKRKKEILERLLEEEKLYVPDLAETLNVSTETIRRDLDRLEKEGKLKKVYGGAVLASNNPLEPPFDQKSFINSSEKQAIGRMAASTIEDGDIIMIGNGTTALEIIHHLSEKRDLTLITHSAPALLLAMEIFRGRIIFIGGEIDTQQKSSVGPLAELTLKKIKANKAFISAGGVSLTEGITDYDLQEAHMSHLLANRSDELIVLADHTKMGEATFANICPIEDVSTIVTDWNCPEIWLEHLREKNVKVLVG
ncbi:DeoR/GlpR family DNA-binding transcription regulator [Cytobacillus sp. Hz8]|uniref:DeoR/GlpR family DNA-binding transcription regulator n=1 Tax=Cytobacillus sp. Hz8 TaxID=3347168 RepID=UPI0035DB98E2